MIYVPRSTTSADSKDSRMGLLRETLMHIYAVKSAMQWVAAKITRIGKDHDHSKISNMDAFHADFLKGFKESSWFEFHKREERHHLSSPDGVRNDVNLLDVIEWITDGVMAGLARTGEYHAAKAPDGLLEKAYDNTVKMILNNVRVKKDKGCLGCMHFCGEHSQCVLNGSQVGEYEQMCPDYREDAM